MKNLITKIKQWQKCEFCGKNFHVKPSRIAAGRGKYCSKVCYINTLEIKKNDIAKLATQGLQTRKIGEILGRKVSMVRGALRKLGIKIKKKLTEDHKQKISPHGRKHTEITKRKMRESQLGEKGHNWKGGHKVKERFHGWKIIKKTILDRDEGKCQKCGKDNVLLDVHHKIPYRCFVNKNDAHDPDNLITLCRKCHFIEEAKKNLNNIKVGKGCKIWDFTNLYGCELGNNVSIGAFTEIGPNVTIGDNTTIGAHSFIPEGFVIGRDVFIGPNFCGTNDRFPPSSKDKWEETIIKDGASIGAGVTIVCGVIVSTGALLGAGSVLTRNIPPKEIWCGVPAKKMDTRRKLCT
jgi:UDP-2-acetamido-3-amino-2,3-dideoxy-glucuronate N-acetyltransferase